MKIEFEPMENQIMIEPIKSDDVTKGGIIMPEMAKTDLPMGEVLKVGAGFNEGIHEDAIQIEVGMVVCFPNYSGRSVTVEGREHMFLERADLLGWGERPSDDDLEAERQAYNEALEEQARLAAEAEEAAEEEPEQEEPEELGEVSAPNIIIK